MTVADTFKADIDTWIAKVKAQADNALKDSSIELVSILKKKSPILTGAFRGNWKIGVNNPVIQYNLTDTAKVPQDSTPQEEELSAYRAALATAKFGDTIYFNESVPYIRRIEFYFVSKKAPKGVARVGFKEFAERIDSILQKSIATKR